ncbi:hypothetical protein J8273_8104 [Carpediemonas membranifera]|uniref:Uncharacterized protein n=1 Tax=Carpediemonas membranifera TaxID=201153 RepID=A0A8J6E120_9EUKA|nr:hypothetical protein J8273_8104 [Carpediemonas membranifera]|eukprot:KAG9390067.1 hypothetical protein J8273_8104 [Carpediemonas membranifera]
MHKLVVSILLLYIVNFSSAMASGMIPFDLGSPINRTLPLTDELPLDTLKSIETPDIASTAVVNVKEFTCRPRGAARTDDRRYEALAPSKLDCFARFCDNTGVTVGDTLPTAFVFFLRHYDRTHTAAHLTPPLTGPWSYIGHDDTVWSYDETGDVWTATYDIGCTTTVDYFLMDQWKSGSQEIYFLTIPGNTTIVPHPADPRIALYQAGDDGVLSPMTYMNNRYTVQPHKMFHVCISSTSKQLIDNDAVLISVRDQCRTEQRYYYPTSICVAGETVQLPCANITLGQAGQFYAQASLNTDVNVPVIKIYAEDPAAPDETFRTVMLTLGATAVAVIFGISCMVVGGFCTIMAVVAVGRMKKWSSMNALQKELGKDIIIDPDNISALLN